MEGAFYIFINMYHLTECFCRCSKKKHWQTVEHLSSSCVFCCKLPFCWQKLNFVGYLRKKKLKMLQSFQKWNNGFQSKLGGIDWSMEKKNKNKNKKQNKKHKRPERTKQMISFSHPKAKYLLLCTVIIDNFVVFTMLIKR